MEPSAEEAGHGVGFGARWSLAHTPLDDREHGPELRDRIDPRDHALDQRAARAGLGERMRQRCGRPVLVVGGRQVEDLLCERGLARGGVPGAVAARVPGCGGPEVELR